MPLEGTANAGTLFWLVEEVHAMALPHQIALPVPPPSREEVEALSVVSAYLSRTGTQVASFLLGCPPLNDDAALLAEFSNSLLGSASLCAGLVELGDDELRL